MSESAIEKVCQRIRARLLHDESGCWLWTGATSSGYGRICYTDDTGKRIWRATHRLIYEAANGPIPDGLDLDHQCHTPDKCKPARAVDCPHRRCCNPEHLQAMTRQENLLRGATVAAQRSVVSECPQGHSYDADNTLVDKLGRRICKACTYERNRAYYWKNRERRNAYNAEWRAKQKE